MINPDKVRQRGPRSCRKNTSRFGRLFERLDDLARGFPQTGQGQIKWVKYLVVPSTSALLKTNAGYGPLCQCHLTFEALFYVPRCERRLSLLEESVLVIRLQIQFRQA